MARRKTPQPKEDWLFPNSACRRKRAAVVAPRRTRQRAQQGRGAQRGSRSGRRQRRSDLRQTVSPLVRHRQGHETRPAAAPRTTKSKNLKRGNAEEVTIVALASRRAIASSCLASRFRVSSWFALGVCRQRGRRICLPAAGAHPSRFTCPNLPRLVAYSASCLPTSLLGLHFRVPVRLCATDNDRCTNTAALQTNPPTAWRGRQPIASSWFHRAVAFSVRVLSFLSGALRASRHRVIVFGFAFSCLFVVALGVRQRGRRIRLPAAGAHPSRFTCPNLPRLVAYSASCLPTSLLRLHFRVLVRLCATDNDRCTNAAALQTNPPTAWRGRQPIASSWFHRAVALAFVPFRFFVVRLGRRAIASSCLASRFRVFAVPPSWFSVSIMHIPPGMTAYKHTPEKPGSDPRDREPADEAPETPTDEPSPVPVQDPPVTEPRAPYTVTQDDIKA